MVSSSPSGAPPPLLGPNGIQVVRHVCALASPSCFPLRDMPALLRAFRPSLSNGRDLHRTGKSPVLCGIPQHHHSSRALHGPCCIAPHVAPEMTERTQVASLVVVFEEHRGFEQEPTNWTGVMWLVLIFCCLGCTGSRLLLLSLLMLGV